MKITRTLAVALLGSAAIAAHASTVPTVSIGLQEDGVNSGGITTMQSAGTNATFTGAYGTFTLSNIYGTGTGNTLSSGSLQASASAGGTLTVYITEQNLTSPTGLSSLLSGFTSNVFTGAVSSVQESSYFSDSNALWDGTLLGSSTFTAIGSTYSTTTAALSAPYSETLKYIITTTGAATVNDTISLTTSAAVTPEPSSLLLLGTGMIGAASLARKRFTQSA